MKTLPQQIRALHGLVAFIVLGECFGCGSKPGVESSGETHFLMPCTDTCPASLACIAGVCTRPCVLAVECKDLDNNAICSSATGPSVCGLACVGPTCSTNDAGADAAPTNSSNEACCEVGPLFGLDDVASQGGVPSIAWNGTEWMVTWADFDGQLKHWRPVSRRVPVDPGKEDGRVKIDMLNQPTSIAFGTQTYGLVLAPQTIPARDNFVSRLAMLDMSGNLAKAVTLDSASEGGAIARYAPVAGWAVLTYDKGPNGVTPQSQLRLFNDQLEALPGSIQLDEIQEADWRPFEVIGFADRVTTVQGQGFRSVIRTFVGAGLTEPFAPRWINAHSTMGAAKVGAKVFIAAQVHNIIETTLYDPQTGVSQGGRKVSASSGHTTLGVSGDDVGMSAGVCFPYENRPGMNADSLRFLVMDSETNMPVGKTVTIAENLQYVAACAVAAGPKDEYLVVFWNADKDLNERRHSIVATRVRVRR